MVRISANGDIIPDDPAPSQRSRPTNSSSSFSDSQNQNQNQRQGVVRLAHDSNPQGAGGGINVSIFDTLNEKLLAQGFPRWNAGPYVVEPIVSVGFILATVLMGFHGLIFAVLLFGLVKYSNSNGGLAGLMGGPSNQGPTGRARGRGGRPNSGTGSGQRLGRL